MIALFWLRPASLRMRHVSVLFLLALAGGNLGYGADALSADVRPAAKTGEVVLRNFSFRKGGTLPELRLRYATWGQPRTTREGQIENAVVLLHGTGGSGLRFGRPLPSQTGEHPLLGRGAPFDANRFFVIAPDAIGSGASSKPSDGLRMKFPAYDLADMVIATQRLLEELGVRRVLAVAGTSMGGRQAWQWAVQFPDSMAAVVPMIASPFPNTGRRALVDLLPQAIILNDPAFENGNYKTNPHSVQIAEQVYDLLGSSAIAMQGDFPTLDAAHAAVFGNKTLYDDDACDFVYQLRLNQGYDAWSEIDRIKARVFMINLADDLLVPAELKHNRQAAERLSRAKYLEVPATGHGHDGLMRSNAVWGPPLSQWLAEVERETGMRR